ncbi:Snurportin-1 [Toxocara canis]|uniref:Snurportin-1 n=1 Tax=Toxocara canis TaxID=6265 RepID=A0A0B2VWC1_TOXCA|nr:Snurportin-1 [Toxocara canis]
MDVGEGSVGEGKRSKGRRSRNRYADELMLSEWLVDIPDTLSTDWICLPCPLGKRALVVASNIRLYAFRPCWMEERMVGVKYELAHKKELEIERRAHYTLLDCVFSPEQLTFYCLDMIAWNDSAVADSDFECRLFLLNSRISENENFKEVSKQFPYRFLCLPSCRCVKSSMEELMRTEFPFELDGVLFYYAGVLYRSGQSPLVGWLKPWMLPEILSVEIPPSLMKGNESTKGAAQKFIDDYNSKHRRPSMKEMPTTTATKRPVDVAIES